MSAAVHPNRLDWHRLALWSVLLLFAVLRRLELPPPMANPARASYMRRDFERSARHLGLAYRHPSRFPVISPLPGRMFHAIAARDPMAAAAFAQAEHHEAAVAIVQRLHAVPGPLAHQREVAAALKAQPEILHRYLGV